MGKNSLFLLCKFSSQDGQKSLGNRVYRIQRIHIRLKSMVPHFYPKMLLALTISRNLTSLVGICLKQTLKVAYHQGSPPALVVPLRS